MTPPPAEIARVGARLLVLDPTGCVLLIHERIEGGEHWITPGGGVEAGETLQQAAAREVFEETSIELTVAPEAHAVLVTRRHWQWAGKAYDQTDHFFVARLTRRPMIVPAAPTPMETQTLLGHRWWSALELWATAETVEPPELAELLPGLVTDWRPDA